MKKLATEKEVAEATRIGLQTLRNHRHLQRGLPYIKIGHSVRYSIDDVITYLQAHRIDPEGAAADR